MAKKLYIQCLAQQSHAPHKKLNQEQKQKTPHLEYHKKYANISGLWTTYGLDGKDWNLRVHFVQKDDNIQVKAETFFRGHWRPWHGSGKIDGNMISFSYKVEAGNNYGWRDGSAMFKLDKNGKMLTGVMRADGVKWEVPVVLFLK